MADLPAPVRVSPLIRVGEDWSKRTIIKNVHNSFKVFFFLCGGIIPLYGLTFSNLHKRDSDIVKRNSVFQMQTTVHRFSSSEVWNHQGIVTLKWRGSETGWCQFHAPASFRETGPRCIRIFRPSSSGQEFIRTVDWIK